MRVHWFAVVCIVSGCTNESTDVPDDELDCATVTDDDEFAIGLVKHGASALDFTIMAGNPAPPTRGDNSWVVQVTTSAGVSVPDASIVVTPIMPLHGHGAGKSVVVETMPDAGQYQLSPVNLWMPGVWETTVQASSASGSDTVVFKFCIPS